VGDGRAGTIPAASGLQEVPRVNGSPFKPTITHNFNESSKCVQIMDDVYKDLLVVSA